MVATHCVVFIVAFLLHAHALVEIQYMIPSFHVFLDFYQLTLQIHIPLQSPFLLEKTQYS